MKINQLVLSALIFCAPLNALAEKPYVIALYDAIKRDGAWRSYFGWWAHSAAEKAALKAALAAGESVATAYYQAIQYANHINDKKTATTLKTNYANWGATGVPQIALISALTTATVVLLRSKQ